MHRHDHVGPLPRGTRRPRQTLFESIKGDEFQNDGTQPQPQRIGSRVKENGPGDGIFGHDLVQIYHVVEGPNGGIIRVNIDNVTLNLSGIQNVKGIPQGVGRGTMAATRVGHEDLNGVDIITVVTACSG